MSGHWLRSFRWVYLRKSERQIMLWSHIFSTVSLVAAAVTIATWVTFDWLGRSHPETVKVDFSTIEREIRTVSEAIGQRRVNDLSSQLVDLSRRLDELQTRSSNANVDQVLKVQVDTLVRLDKLLQDDFAARGKQAEDALAAIDRLGESVEGVRRMLSFNMIAGPAVDVVKVIAEKFVGQIPNPEAVRQEVKTFLVQRGASVTDTVLTEVTKSVMCYFSKSAGCPASATATASAVANTSITISPALIQVKPASIGAGEGGQSPPGIVVIRKNAALDFHASVWFRRSDSVDDEGALTATIIPRIERALGVRRDCALHLDGHADSAGTDDYNKALSERRVATIKNKLVSHFPWIKITQPEGRGERALVRWTADGIHNVYNRRVDIHLQCGESGESG